MCGLLSLNVWIIKKSVCTAIYRRFLFELEVDSQKWILNISEGLTPFWFKTSRRYCFDLRGLSVFCRVINLLCARNRINVRLLVQMLYIKIYLWHNYSFRFSSHFGAFVSEKVSQSCFYPIFLTIFLLSAGYDQT